MKRQNFSSSKNAPKSFFKKVLLSLLTVTLLITLLLNSFLTFNYIKTSISLTEQFHNNLLAQTNYAITKMDDDAWRLSQSLFGNKDIISFLNMKKEGSTAPSLASIALNYQLLTLPNVESIYLYNAHLDTFYSSKTGEQQKSAAFSDQEIARLADEGQDKIDSMRIPVATHISSFDQNARTLSYILYDSPSRGERKRNAIIINVKSYLLTDSIRAINAFSSGLDMDYIVFDSSGNILSSVLRPELAAQSELYPLVYQRALEKPVTDSPFFRIDSRYYLLTSTAQNEYGWYIVSLTPASFIFRQLLMSSLISGIIAIAVFLFCSAICLLLARRLNSPLQTITSLMRGEKTDAASSSLQQTEEFRCILSVFDSMKKQNEQLDKLKRDTSYALRQDCLNSLLVGNSTKSPQETDDFMRHQNLSWLAGVPLCMCVLKLDDYHKFLEKNDPKEYWILHFAIVNISEELAGNHFRCCVFSRNNDKFIILLDCSNVSDYSKMQLELEALLTEIQNNVSACMHLSISASYSTIFSGTEQLPSMYRNMKDSLRLKMKYGHGCIISPYMADELDADPLTLPANRLNQLISSITAVNTEEAISNYRKLSAQQLSGSYTEIISSSIHLLYSIYSGLLPQYPALNENLTPAIQDALEQLHTAEVWSDITATLEQYITCACAQVEEQKQNAALSGSNGIPAKILKIIETEYPNPALCLSSIAGDIGLSPNYVGQVFKTAIGKSVAQYILDYRMDKLAEYLNTSRLPLNSILEIVGIEKSNYFYTQFKKHFGMALGEYRLLHANEENDASC